MVGLLRVRDLHISGVLTEFVLNVSRAKLLSKQTTKHTTK